ncbi:ABC transporter permease [Ancylobacter sp. 6x-1]|uniref:ABC transporter permease n=1 Tax=Ancylobacter crimeensis TaxID=2579147 RepID=A0ABT0D701_9HYPH|nr:ABC transporter permease [Ancylobacter crimeensis]MCK0195716.1 ABC transporter permease [Ancylobacter crimeensis]
MRTLISRTLWTAFGATMLAFLLAPTLFTVLFSFSEARYFSFPMQSYSLRWYTAFFGAAKFQKAAIETGLLALIVTPGCLAAALCTAHAVARWEFRGKRLVDSLILSPLIVPGVVTGVAFLSLFRILHQDIGLVRMSIAMMVVCLPYAVRAVSANYGGVDRATEEAARDLGAGPLLAYLKVTLPQLKPGLLAGGVFVLVEVIDNFAVNVFLVDLDSNTLPIVAYQHIRDFDDPLVAVMSTLLSALTLALVILFNRVIGLEKLSQSR